MIPFSKLACTAFLGGFATLPANATPHAYIANYNGDWGVVNLTTGAYTSCGNNVITLAGLAWASKTTLVSGEYRGNALYLVNPTTGYLGPLGFASTATGIGAFGGTKTAVYFVDADPTNMSLYSVNVSTGTATLIGLTGLGFQPPVGSLSNGGTKLFLNLNQQLYTLNLTTGKAKKAFLGTGQFGAMMSIGANMWGGNAVGTQSIYKIAPAAHTETFVANITGETNTIFGMAASGKGGQEAGCAP